MLFLLYSPTSKHKRIEFLPWKKFDSAATVRFKFFKFSNFPFNITSPLRCLNFETLPNCLIDLTLGLISCSMLSEDGLELGSFSGFVTLTVSFGARLMDDS